MNGDVKRAARAGAWVGGVLCALVGCNAGPDASGVERTGVAPASVREAVRVATDRSAAQMEVVTLPDGQRLRRVGLTGYSHVLIGKIGPDGRPSIACVDSAPAADSFLASGGQGNGQ